MPDLRTLLRGPGIVVAPGAFDPFSALVLEGLGFPALYLGGNAIGLQLGVGQPFVTMSETADSIRRITRVASVPLLADAGAGFGDAAHVRITMQELERAGAAALHFDDQVYPKRAHYHRGTGRLAEPATVAAKLATAVQARRKADTLVIARTDALRVTRSIDDTIARGRVYAQAGIDALMVLDLDVEQAPLVRHALPELPLIWIGGIAEPVPSIAQLQAAGFSMAVYPFTTVAAIGEAIRATWKDALATGRPAAPARPIAESVRGALDLVGMQKFWDIEKATTEKGEG